MKIYKYLAIILLLVVFFGNYSKKTFAQNKISEDYSQAVFLEKIPSDLILSVDKKNYNLSSEEISSWLEEKNILFYSPNYLSEIENTNFCIYKNNILCRLIFPYKKQVNIKKKHFLIANEKSIENFITDFSRTVNKDPENGKFKVENGKVVAFAISSDGIKLDEEKSKETIINYLVDRKYSQIINLPFKKIKPEISTDSIDNLGITTLIGQGISNFKGSPKNRIFNINVATSRFNGTLIKPGEEFSFVKILGEVDAEHGYLPELVIKKDKTELEFGGGICQVSTTAFRAAINTGLEITARKNHAYPVAYYNPQGMDATVYIPYPDLRFINNTPNYILIETKIEETELIFNFYGTSDGRKVNVVGPTILSRGSDGSMKTTFTQQVFDKNENLIREDVFNSNYDSPNNYPHPGDENTFTKKPDDWSKKEWREYKKEHNL